MFQELSCIMLSVHLRPVSQHGSPRLESMYVHWLASVVDIPPSLFMLAVFEDIGDLKKTDSVYPSSNAGIHIAGVTAVEQLDQEDSANACCTSAAAGDCLSVSLRS